MTNEPNEGQHTRLILDFRPKEGFRRQGQVHMTLYMVLHTKEGMMELGRLSTQGCGPSSLPMPSRLGPANMRRHSSFGGRLF